MAFQPENDITPIDDVASEPSDSPEESEASDYYLKVAQEAYQASTSYIDSNYRSRWENAIRHFQSKHSSGSKYNKATYQYRSKLFRPKSRAMSRNFEAGLAAAFFSNSDLVNLEPADQDNPIQAASADICFQLMQHHLTTNIPWFKICVGAGQEAHRTGVVFSYQNWTYVEKQNTYQAPALDEQGQPVIGEDGQPVVTTATEPVVLKDCPVIELLPPENIRFHPAAKWYDPIGTSPFLQILWPMFARDVKARMKQGGKGKVPVQPWKPLTDAEIGSASRLTNDSTRRARDDNREDADEKPIGSVKEFDVVWAIENFVNMDGQDVVYWTLGTEHLLSDPAPIEEVYWTGERPVVMGIAAIETFVSIPEGPLGHVIPLQQEINEVVNQRLDNVKLVMNKRWLVRQGSSIDLRSLLANVPGSVTTVPGDFDQHLREVEFKDVTGSAYQEQDRLNVEFDELAGNFSQSSVMTNRSLNETVGGMNMLRSGSSEVRELTIRTFSETWVEKVFAQLVKLIQKYESNMALLALCGQKAKLFQKYNIDQVTDQLLNQSLTVSINVGIGSTDPVGRLQKFLMAGKEFMGMADAQAKIMAAGGAPILKLDEVGKEIFGRIGLKSGSRFLVGADSKQIDPAQVQQMAMQMQQMQQMIQQLQAEVENKDKDRQVKLITQQMVQEGEDRRKAAELQTRLASDKARLEAQSESQNLDLHVDAINQALDRQHQAAVAEMQAEATRKAQKSSANRGE
jgi:hypothetical protein